ncbi:hypothetical protein D3C86_1582580 [compost metagenome]
MRLDALDLPGQQGEHVGALGWSAEVPAEVSPVRHRDASVRVDSLVDTLCHFARGVVHREGQGLITFVVLGRQGDVDVCPDEG